MNQSKLLDQNNAPIRKASFVDTNKNFWKDFREHDGHELILVETSDNPVINHSNAVAAKMIARAKKLRIAWIKEKYTDEPLMRSYSPGAEFIAPPSLPLRTLAKLAGQSIWSYLRYVLVINRIHSFKFSGIPYGDFLYDNYLAMFSMATLHRWDARMSLVFYHIMVKDTQARLTFRKNAIKAVLVSHYIGLQTGPLARVAIQQRMPVFWKGGGDGVLNLAVFDNLDMIYDYPNRPGYEMIKALVRLPSGTVESELKELMSKAGDPLCKTYSVAYDRRVFSDTSRKEFLNTMGLKDQPVVFVMLHAFNDHPHSHFRQMLFADYYDWFVRTLRFAKKDRTKNWIFKEHPANMMYPTQDIDLKKIMTSLPTHVKFVTLDSDVKASTVMNVADLIVTCLGSAGLEMPAMKGIPSIIASDTFYDGFGFTMEPRSQKEYFRMLEDFIPYRLSPEQQRTAQCCYLYLNKYCMNSFTAGPPITFAERQNTGALKLTYSDRIRISYQEQSEMIYKEFHEYTAKIKANGFRRLETIPASYKNDCMLNEREHL